MEHRQWRSRSRQLRRSKQPQRSRQAACPPLNRDLKILIMETRYRYPKLPRALATVHHPVLRKPHRNSRMAERRLR
jgi:hypothetical protein